MGLSAQLVPPPAVNVDSDGPVGAAIAEAMHRHLGPTTPGAAPGGSRPLIVMVEPGEDALLPLPDRITAATRSRGQRVWVVVTQTAQVQAVDAIVDRNPGVDALVLVDNSHPATAGAALAAWTWLRHDAPSLALGTLRDSSGRVCRVATVTAQAPAQPPSNEAPAPAASVDKVEQALVAGTAQAQALGNEAAQGLLLEPDVSKVVSELEGAVDAGVKPASAALLDEVRHWGPSDLNQLRDFTEKRVEQMVSDEASLTSAAVAVGKADAALAQETERTGLSSMFGRKKRLAALTQSRDQAWETWCATVTAQGESAAQRRYLEQVAAGLPLLLSSSEEQWRQTADKRAREALGRWLDTTTAAATRLVPPLPSADVTIARTWGDATPEVRRHLLVPTTAAVEPGDTSNGTVNIHGAEGLQHPLAIAWLLGLSASSFAPTDS